VNTLLRISDDVQQFSATGRCAPEALEQYLLDTGVIQKYQAVDYARQFGSSANQVELDLESDEDD
jgi:hypothetical protein